MYQELLSGTVPYPARTGAALQARYAAGPPDLTGLPGADRRAVARALEVDPAARFESCLGFARALAAARDGTADDGPTQSGLIRYVVRQSPVPARPDAGGDLPTTFLILTPAPTEESVAADLTRAFPGFRLIEVVGDGPRGVVVRAADPAGRLYIVRLVTGDPATVDGGDKFLRLVGAIARLRCPQIVSGRHPRLVGFARRDDFVTLADIDRHQVKAGAAGIPKPDLLRYLGQAAKQLDAAAADAYIGHLLVDPTSIVVNADRVGVVDYGVGELLRRTSPAGRLGRDRPAGRPGTPDRHPRAGGRPVRPGSGVPRTHPGVEPERQTVEPRRGAGEPDAAAGRAGTRCVDAGTRPDPAARFGSCREFVAALDRVGPWCRPSTSPFCPGCRSSPRSRC